MLAVSIKLSVYDLFTRVKLVYLSEKSPKRLTVATTFPQCNS